MVGANSPSSLSLSFSLVLSTPPMLSGEIEADGDHEDGEPTDTIGPKGLVQKLLPLITIQAMQLFLLGPLQRLGDHQQTKHLLLHHQVKHHALQQALQQKRRDGRLGLILHIGGLQQARLDTLLRAIKVPIEN